MEGGFSFKRMSSSLLETKPRISTSTILRIWGKFRWMLAPKRIAKDHGLFDQVTPVFRMIRHHLFSIS